MPRPSWDEYFIGVMNAIAERATCDRGMSGCVITRDHRQLVAGYVGSPIGFPHCSGEDGVGHDMRKVLKPDDTISEHCMRTVHAEANAIFQAARLGVAIQGATLYCRMTPCRNICGMAIIQCGIVRVVCERKYPHAAETEEMFRSAGIELLYIHDEVQSY